MSDGTLSEDDLRYWLVNEDWYVSRHVQEWVDKTPREESVAMLRHIAADADPEPRSTGLAFLTFMAISGFSMTGSIAGEGPDRRKAGIRAALMLAKLDDATAIAPLARVFETDPRRQNKYQELIEAALAKLLPQAAVRPEAEECVPAVSGVLERTWKSGREARDLSPVLADVAVACLEFLHRQRDGNVVPEVVRVIARSENTKPNRRRVVDAARERFGSGS